MTWRFERLPEARGLFRSLCGMDEPDGHHRRGNRSPSKRRNKRHDAGSAASSSNSDDARRHGDKIKAPFEISSSVDVDVGGQGSGGPDDQRKYKFTTPLQFSAVDFQSKSKMEVAQHALESGDGGDGGQKSDKPESWVSHYIEREPGGQYIKLGVVIETKIRLDPRVPFGAQNIQFGGPPDMKFSAGAHVPADRRSISSGTSISDVPDGRVSDVSDEKYSDESARPQAPHHAPLDSHGHHHPPLDEFLQHEHHHENHPHESHHEKNHQQSHAEHRHENQEHGRHDEEERKGGHRQDPANNYEESSGGWRSNSGSERDLAVEQEGSRSRQTPPVHEAESRRSSSGSDRSPRRKRGDSRGREVPPPQDHHGEAGGRINQYGIPLSSHGLPLPPPSARRRSSWALGEIPIPAAAASSQHHRRRSSVMPHEVVREHRH